MPNSFSRWLLWSCYLDIDDEDSVCYSCFCLMHILAAGQDYVPSYTCIFILFTQVSQKSHAVDPNMAIPTYMLGAFTLFITSLLRHQCPDLTGLPNTAREKAPSDLRESREVSICVIFRPKQFVNNPKVIYGWIEWDEGMGTLLSWVTQEMQEMQCLLEGGESAW